MPDQQNDLIPTPMGPTVRMDLPAGFWNALKEDAGNLLAGIVGIVGTPRDVLQGKYDIGELNELAPGYAAQLALAGLAVPAPPVGALRSFGPVWHGTPHTFQPEEGFPLGRFKNEAIGTGEGAQAYGHGHYVAGSQGVASSYRPPGIDVLHLDDTPIHRITQFEPDAERALNAASNYLGTVGPSRNPDLTVELGNVVALLRNQPEWMTKYGPPDLLAEYQRSADWLANNVDRIKYRNASGGHLLEVHVRPDEHELLDWDTPLDKQSSQVLEKLDSFLRNTPYQDRNTFANTGVGTGEGLYKVLTEDLGSKQAASQALSEAGIPGVKYLDAMSRRAGEGTRNYVIFDPNDLHIVGRDGQRLYPVDHDPFSGETGK